METAKDSWRAIRPSTALHSGLKPSCCSQNIWGPPWHFEKPMMQPGHQLISEDSALVPMASLSHTDVLTTHQSSNPSICTYDTSKFQPIWWKPENTCLQVLLIQSSGALYILYILIFQGQPETTGLRPALMKGTISCWWCSQQKLTPWSFHLGFTAETSPSLVSNLLLYFIMKNIANSEVLEPLPMTTVTYFPTCSRKDLNPLIKLQAEWNKMKW